MSADFVGALEDATDALVAGWASVIRVAKKPGVPRTTITAADIAPAETPV
jgi:hypothetical protein